MLVSEVRDARAPAKEPSHHQGRVARSRTLHLSFMRLLRFNLKAQVMGFATEFACSMSRVSDPTQVPRHHA